MIDLVEIMESQALFDNRYQLKKLIGNGGFAQVWLANDTIAGMELALKIYMPNGPLDEQGKADFKREFANLCGLNHTNIIHAIGFGICNDELPYLAMNVCKGGSGKNLIGKANEDQLWDFLKQVTSGLQYLHNSHHMVHQDIKPDNVLINDEGQYLIIDFGISKKTRNTLRKSTDGNVGSGTTWYMSVESFGHDDPVFARDIWALGATMYELMTGDVPFGQYGGLAQKERNGKIPPVTQEFSGELIQLVYDCLALDTWNRPSADEILQRIENHENGIRPSVLIRILRYWRRIERHWRHAAAGTVAVIAFVMVMILGWEWMYVVPKEAESKIAQERNDSVYLARLNNTERIISEESATIRTQKEAKKISVRKLADAVEEYPMYQNLEDSISDTAKQKARTHKDSMMRSLTEVENYLEATAQGKLTEYGEFGRESYNLYMSISDSIKDLKKLIN